MAILTSIENLGDHLLRAFFLKIPQSVRKSSKKANSASPAGSGAKMAARPTSVVTALVSLAHVASESSAQCALPRPYNYMVLFPLSSSLPPLAKDDVNPFAASMPLSMILDLWCTRSVHLLFF